MTGKERFSTALRCEQPDIVPLWELAIIESSIIGIAKQFTDDVPEFKLLHEMDPNEVIALLRTLFFVVEQLDLDAFTLPVQQGSELVAENRIRDRLGIVYIPSDNGLAHPVQGAITNPDELAAYKLPKVDDSWFTAAQFAKMYFGDKRAVVVMPPDPFKTYWAIQGDMQNALMTFYTDPEFAHGVLRVATDIALDVINTGADAGIEYFCLTGDLAMNTGPMISPDTFRKFIKPYYIECVEASHSKGVPIIKHSCGDTSMIIDDFVDAGFDGVHPIQPQCMDIGEVKARIGGKACVLGNIDCVDLLINATPDEVDEVVRQTIRTAAPGGGFVLASANSIHKDVKPENAVAMFRAGRKYGKYPIE
ncbi:MAG TPA: uroporphyrinogen decarboxylase family protein [bacterium]|nr:uroporphyrinogen decarboxylase family protein [bacterium]